MPGGVEPIRVSRVPIPESDPSALERQALLSRLPSRGTIIAGKYRIGDVLGSGAMGCVVAAEHLLMQRNVAIKFVIGCASNANAVQRFFREARVTQSLQDEHVVRVYDLGVLDNGTPYLVMEHLEGRDLGQLLKAQGKLPAEEAVDYVLAACQALAEAHASGIVHRDIKPSNLLLSSRKNGAPLLKVVDFGISKLLDDDQGLDASLTASVSLLGSPLYMSPEQVRSAKAIDERCDVWALGVTLYALLTARAPFQGDGVHGVCAAIVADPPAPFQPEDAVDSALQDVVLACLVKRPEERTASVSALAAQLTAFASKAGQLCAARIDTLYTRQPESSHSAWQPQLAVEATADAVSGEAATAAASHVMPAADGGTLNHGTAQTLAPQPALRARRGRRRAGLTLAIAGGVLLGGVGARHLLSTAAADDTAVWGSAQTASGGDGESPPGKPDAPAAVAATADSAETAAVPEGAAPAGSSSAARIAVAEPRNPPAARITGEPGASEPSPTLAGSATAKPATPRAAKPSVIQPSAGQAAGAASSAPPAPGKPKPAAKDDDGFAIPD